MDVSEAGWGHPDRGPICCWVARVLRTWLAEGEPLLRIRSDAEAAEDAEFHFEVSSCGSSWRLVESAPQLALRATLGHLGATYVGELFAGSACLRLRSREQEVDVALCYANESGSPFGFFACRLDEARRGYSRSPSHSA